MSLQLFGKKEIKRLGSIANDGAGAGFTSFAKKMMARMGWEEGQGLGKDKQGMSTYVQVKKKDDNAGLGKDLEYQRAVNDQWYFDAFDAALANVTGGKKAKKTKKKKRKEREEKEKEKMARNGEAIAADSSSSMYAKMFEATGGARMGMRARAPQNGKLARTEGGDDGTMVFSEKSAGDEAGDTNSRKSKKRKRDTAERKDGGEKMTQGRCGVDGVDERADKGVAAAGEGSTDAVEEMASDVISKKTRKIKSKAKAKAKRAQEDAGKDVGTQMEAEVGSAKCKKAEGKVTKKPKSKLNKKPKKR